MAKDKINFTSPIHLACADDELRPTFECVHFVDGYMYASDGYMVAKQSLEYSTIAEVDQLNGMSMHRDSFKEILTFQFATATGDGIECKDENGRTAFFEYHKIEGKIPDFEKVISEYNNHPTALIGLDPKFIHIAGKILHGGEKLKVAFNGGTKGMMITTTDYENQLVFLMPVILEPTLF